MKAKFVRQLSFDLALYKCDPPMRFVRYVDGNPCDGEIVESPLVAIFCGQRIEGMHAAVLHAARETPEDAWNGQWPPGKVGPGAIEMGGDCMPRRFDAKLTEAEALALAGYEVDA